MIEVSNLTKRYGAHTAVSDLSFKIEKGRIYGFLGPNGAGKSTTMNIITGCLAATGGKVAIGGYDIFDEPIKAKKLIGYLPELPPLYTDMTPGEYLKFVARAKGLTGAEVKKQVESAIATTHLEDVKQRLIKNLSKGYKQRVGIAQALLGNPEVIILDEPTVGLDPKQIIEIRALIKDLGREHTVILSSHILSEVNAICDEIIIISGGKLVAADTPDNLTRLFAGSSRITVRARCQKEALNKALEGLGEIKSLTDDGELSTAEVEFEADYPNPSEEIFTACVKSGLTLNELKMEHASLEDVFLELTSGDNAESSENTAEAEPETDEPEAIEPEANEPEADEGGENK